LVVFLVTFLAGFLADFLADYALLAFAFTRAISLLQSHKTQEKIQENRSLT